jgi:inorganic triphosphatase YgiF
MSVNSTKTLTRPEPAWQHQRDLPIVGTRPSRSATAGEVVLAYLRVQAHELRSLDPAVRADEYDAVHQMRVTTRRLRATLRSFGRVIPRAETAHLAGENAFTYGLLHERERHQAATLQSAARKTWKKASRQRHRRWMS